MMAKRLEKAIGELIDAVKAESMPGAGLIDRAERELAAQSWPTTRENLVADLEEAKRLGYELLDALKAVPRRNHQYDVEISSGDAIQVENSGERPFLAGGV